jgi:hypothetical protein
MATNPLVGSPSVAERTSQQSIVFKTLAKRIASTLRCGLPGIITDFNPTTQYAKVLLAIKENVLKATGLVVPTPIPILEDVLVILPGDANWCLTFPSLVNSECYVCFADMCINEWSTYGFQKNINGNWVPRNQEVQRRHDLSDGFAILAPRSQKTRIPNYSTTNVELRSMDGNTKLALTNSGTVLMKGTGLEIDGTGGIIVKPGTTPSNACIAVTINGVVYYIRLSATP